MGSLLNEHPHPSNKPISLGSTNLLQTPLTRTGHGPGLLLIVPHDYQGPISGDLNKTLDPDPLRKWAEEGFAVAEVRLSARAKTAVEDLQQAVKALLEMPQCNKKEKVGVIGEWNLYVVSLKSSTAIIIASEQDSLCIFEKS